MRGKKYKILETRYFGFFIGFLVFALFVLFKSFSLFSYLDMVMLDANFNLRSVFTANTIQVGVTQQTHDPKISSDILIVGVDNRSLDRFGKWPWPRYRHADFLNTLSRIKNQNERESSVFLDFFFVEKSPQVEQDALLIESIKENGKVVIETVLDPVQSDSNILPELYDRQRALFINQKPFSKIYGDTSNMKPYLGVQPPLKPIALVGAGFGHPNFGDDIDKTFRRQELIVRYSELTEQIKFSELSLNLKLDITKGDRLAWTDKAGVDHNVSYPLSEEYIKNLGIELKNLAPPIVIEDDSSVSSQTYIINKYRDYFLPSITLTLALRYFNKSISDIEVVIGQYIKIKNPQHFDPINGVWNNLKLEKKAAVFSDKQVLISPAEYDSVPEIKIPIDNTGGMLINFMGASSGGASTDSQTFPVRSYAGYAARATATDPESWPKTLTLANKIIMAGIYSQGTASDDKKTPFGIMYGIEVHANALNTILMNNFISSLLPWQNLIIILFFCMVVAFFTSRLKTPIALVLTFTTILLFFFSSTLLFDYYSILVDFAIPAFGMISTLLAIVVYRVMTEEKEKLRIQSMFGKYVSKTVVDQMVAQGQQPELGGVDKELTVFFSDIRGFTTLSEAMTPQELVTHLNAYLTAMTDIIMEYQGTLDKYVGDEVMCFWGAPVPQKDHALLACKCALRQMDKLAELNASWSPEKRIDIGIGINSGIMTVGNMGSIGRMNYTLMGDNVNLGARLEGTNKQYYTHIIISEYTYGLVKDKIVAREIDNIRVKGKNKPVLIYELLDII